MATIARAPLRALPDIGMSQTSLLVGTLLGAFVLYLAMNNRLSVYWSLLTGGTGATAIAAQPSTSLAPAAPATPTAPTTTLPSS
jgi:hypothetical protein